MSACQPDEFAGSMEQDPHPDDDPFAPPEDFEHGPEFSADVPRSLPASARRSRYVRVRWGTVWKLGMIGSACWATHPLPFVERLSWYLLPLGYLNWVGWGLLFLAGIHLIRNATTLGQLAYVVRGKPLTARIRHLGVNVEGTQASLHGQFVAEVEFRNPETNRLQTATILAPETFLLSQSSEMDAGVEPGEYVTLVYLPGRLEKSLQLYGWLGLSPDLDLIRKNGRTLEPTSPLTALMIVIGITGLGWGLLGFLYVIGRYTPLDENDWRPFAIAAGITTMPLIILLILRVERDGATTFALIKAYVFAVFLGLVGGFMAAFMAVGFLNGYFDRSPPHLEPVKVVQLWEQTIEFAIRTYELEYHPYPKGKAEKKMVTVETLSAFQPDTLGVIDVGRGWLGLRWLRDFHPVHWHAVEPGTDGILPGEITFQLPNQPPMRIAPQVVLSKEVSVSPPELLLPELRTRMVSYLTQNLKATVIGGEP